MYKNNNFELNNRGAFNMCAKLRKVVITGCTGTIGVALVNRLTEFGIQCVLLNPARFVNKDAYVDKSKLEFIDCALDQYESFAKSKELPDGCDAFIHLAWQGTIGPGRDDVKLQLENLKGAVDAVELAKAMGCKCFVGAGSQAEYGKGVEDYPREYRPVTGYGMAKLSASHLCKLKAHQLGLRFNWVRIFSVFGPHSSSLSLTQYVVESLLNGISPELTKCEQVWDFLYTKDAVDAIWAIAERGKDGKTYELGSGQTGTIRSFLENVPEWLGIDVALSFGAKEYPPNQIMKMCADIKELQEDTGWKPAYTFKDGILAIAASLRQ